MKGAGDAILGVGAGEGENRAIDAAQNAISNPMLENSHIDGATKILINITSDDSLTMPEIDEISNNIKASASQSLQPALTRQKFLKMQKIQQKKMMMIIL